jgi:hypothetical protein
VFVKQVDKLLLGVAKISADAHFGMSSFSFLSFRSASSGEIESMSIVSISLRNSSSISTVPKVS